MKTPGIACERCGGRDLRRARFRGLGELAAALFAIYPFRCRDCQHRFLSGILLSSKWLLAKCPRCLNLELETWSRKHFNPGLFSNLLITCGAAQYRCTRCRCNFVSFRPRSTGAAAAKPL